MKKRNFNIGSIILVLALIFSSILPFSASAAKSAASDLMKITKTVDVTSLVENDIANVTLSVKGTPKDSTYVRPNDVILIVDKSGSMQADNRLNAAKEATKEFIDLMDLTKHQVGIVDYSTSVSSYPLTTDATDAKNYVDTIRLGGGTETGLAVKQATAMLANHRPEAQPTIVILTDGAATNTADALASAKAAKDAGIIFYSIALLAPNEDPNTSEPNQLLKDMSTSADHHHFVLGSVGLSDVYKQIVEEIGLASAYNVKITDTIAPEFEIVPGSYDNNIPKPNVNGNTLEWDIKELKSKELTFTYQVRAKTTTTAGKYLLGTTSADFEDPEKNTHIVSGTNPTIEVLNLAPVITSINPEKGLTTGGEEVTITGENFLPGARVYFGSKEATVLSESSNKIIVTTPTGSQGTVEVKVINPDKQAATGSFMYYAQPTLTSITPAEGELVGGNRVILNGSNFDRNAKIYFGTKEVNVEYFTSASTIRVMVPAGDVAGKVTVKVVNPDGLFAELADAYEYLAPPPPPPVELISLTPTSGKLVGGEKITLNGANFDKSVQVYFGDKEAVVTSIFSSANIQVVVPQGDAAGKVTVKVVNPDGSIAELTDGYEYLPAPTIQLDRLSATSGKLVGGERINLIGAEFDRNAKIYFGTKEVSIDYFTSASNIRVKVPAGDVAGKVTVKVVNPDGAFAELADAYEYLAPPPPPPVQLISLTPTSGKLVGGERITLNGANFDKSVQVYFGDKEAVVTSVLSSAKIQVVVPQGDAAGKVTVKVVNPDGSIAELADAYEYLAPPPPPVVQLNSLDVTSGKLVGGERINLIGANFDRDAKIYFGTKEVNVDYFTSASKIRVMVPAGDVAGKVTVKVVNPDGTFAELADAYEYLAPPPPPPVQLDSLSVATGKLAGGERINLIGANFDRNAKIYFGTKEVNVDYFVSASNIRVMVPAGDVAGKVTVKVVNPDGEFAELTDGFEYLPAPNVQLDRLSATSGKLVGGERINLIGAEFDRNAKIYFGTKEVSVDYYTSSSNIRVMVPASDVAGKVTVKVVNPDGTFAELADAYEYLAPPPPPPVKLNSLSVTKGKLAGGERINLIGANFDRNAKIYFGTKEVNVDYFTSASKIRVMVPAGDVAGKVTVKVVNPDGTFAELVDAYEYLPAP